jgi:pterin-4a-carbinolamine dehydratase
VARTHRDRGPWPVQREGGPVGAVSSDTWQLYGQAEHPDEEGTARHHAQTGGVEAGAEQAFTNVRVQDFVQSLSFVNSLVAYFETIDHHPDVYIAYGEVTFELTRYDVGGKVTDRDVEVAKKISSVYRARS